MLQPPVSEMAPWRPDHWITHTGYALNEEDITAGTKNLPKRRERMIKAVLETQDIIERIMQP